MIGRGVIIAAVATYLAVVGCVMWPADRTPRAANGFASETVAESSLGAGSAAGESVAAESSAGEPSSAEHDPGVGPDPVLNRPSVSSPNTSPVAAATASRVAPGRDTPRPAAVRPARSGLPYCGVAMQIQRIDLINEYEKSIDEIAALGADTVSIVVDCRQENGSSGRIFMDMRMTPTPQGLDRKSVV